ncbi:DUF2156 domain-containing protein [Terrabacter sp. NPDC000476]|uniref:bifunctional lysylphosphatidylglycerol flippase/synthetase MprF n=1 Tax=Terrabacter sp. NPDC000476 TaxID=3154258 RepID=UPI00331AB8A6
MAQTETTGSVETRPGKLSPATVAALLRRIPFTISVVGAMVVLGVVTTSLWRPLEDRDLFSTVAYGLPALQDGRWWTPVTGAFFALVPLQYVAVAGGALLLLGWSELRLGTRRTAAVSGVCHLAGVLGASLLLLPVATSSWSWAERTATTLDVGFSTGALGAVAAATVTLSPPWRGRARSALALYAVLFFLYIGLLWDLEHLIAILTGLAAGPFLVGRRPRLARPTFTRHEWRLFAFVGFLVVALIRVLLYAVPSDGPLGASSEDSSATTVLVGAAFALLLADGLRRGSRRVWQVAGALTTLTLLVSVVVIVVELRSPDVLDAGGGVSSSLPELVVDALLSLLQLSVLILGRAAFRARRPSRRARDAAAGAPSGAGRPDRDTAVALLKEHGGSTMAWMGTWPDNDWFIHRAASGDPVGYIAFQSHRGVAIALGDPVAADAQGRAETLGAFVDVQEARGLAPCLFSVGSEAERWGAARGHRSLVVAEEAVIDLPDLEFKGKQWQSVRTALNRAGKEGITYREGRLAEMPRGVLTQVRAISELWVGDKGLPEMGFTLGGVDEALDPDTLVGLAVDADHTVHGVTSWLPVHGPGGRVRGRTLDVMRRLPDGFRPVTEFLIASACLSFKEQGADLVSLSGAPLAHAGGTADADALDRLLGALGEAMEPLYGFRSLESFKQKFSPRNEPVHLVFRDEAALPRIGLALTSAYLPGSTLRDLARAGLSARHVGR